MSDFESVEGQLCLLGADRAVGLRYQKQQKGSASILKGKKFGLLQLVDNSQVADH